MMGAQKWLKTLLVPPSCLSPCPIEQLKSAPKEFSHSGKALGCVFPPSINKQSQSEFCHRFSVKTEQTGTAFAKKMLANSIFIPGLAEPASSTSKDHPSPPGDPHPTQLPHSTTDTQPDGFVSLRCFTSCSPTLNADNSAHQAGRGLLQALISKEATLPWLPTAKPLPKSAFALGLSCFPCH